MSFARFNFAHATALPVELAVLLVGVASRQAASPTARIQASLIRRGEVARLLLAPVAGCFSAATAAAITSWQGE